MTEENKQISQGRVFHNFDAMTQKALSWFVTCLISEGMGTCSSAVKDDCSGWVGLYGGKWSFRYTGPTPYRAL